MFNNKYNVIQIIVIFIGLCPHFVVSSYSQNNNLNFFFIVASLINVLFLVVQSPKYFANFFSITRSFFNFSGPNNSINLFSRFEMLLCEGIFVAVTASSLYGLKHVATSKIPVLVITKCECWIMRIAKI